MEPRYSAPAFNIIPPVEYTNFGPLRYFYSYSYVGNIENLTIEHNNFISKKHFYSYSYVGNSENIGLEHYLGQSFEVRYSGV